MGAVGRGEGGRGGAEWNGRGFQSETLTDLSGSYWRVELGTLVWTGECRKPGWKH